MTDRRTDDDSIYRASIASRGKNERKYVSFVLLLHVRQWTALVICVSDGYRLQRHCWLLLFSEVDECVSNPCQFNGRCIDALKHYTCLCTERRTGNNCQYGHHTPRHTIRYAIFNAKSWLVASLSCVHTGWGAARCSASPQRAARTNSNLDIAHRACDQSCIRHDKWLAITS